MNESVNQFDDADRVTERIARIKLNKTKTHFYTALQDFQLRLIRKKPML